MNEVEFNSYSSATVVNYDGREILILFRSDKGMCVVDPSRQNCTTSDKIVVWIAFANVEFEPKKDFLEFVSPAKSQRQVSLVISRL